MHFKRFRLGKNLKVVCSSHEKTTFWVKKKTARHIHQTEKGSNKTEEKQKTIHIPVVWTWRSDVVKDAQKYARHDFDLFMTSIGLHIEAAILVSRELCFLVYENEYLESYSLANTERGFTKCGFSRASIENR